MKAYVYTKYGPPDVLELKEVEKPAPKDNELLVKIHAVSVNAADWHLLTADIFLVRLMAGGLLKPKDTRLGIDLAGEVEAVGGNIKQFKPGDQVYGGGEGSFAEYAIAHENDLALKPANCSFEEAAAVPVAALTALQGLRDKGQIQPGHKVLINGATGGVGSFAVQIARSFGADVTAVCSTSKVDMVRSLGADRVIDYTKEDVTRSEQHFDLIFAVNGYHSISAYKRVLAPKGIYVMAGGSPGQLLQGVLLGSWMSRSGEQKFGNMLTKLNHDDLVSLKELLEAGKIEPVIDKRYAFNELREALRLFGEGHSRGKIVVKIG
jgi:NADPH:quinone reductase-like Zn-dependent oxidoreductase